MHDELRARIETLWAEPAGLTGGGGRHVEEAIEALDRGQIRVAEPDPAGGWVVNEWVKQAILLYFRLRPMVHMEAGLFTYRDKVEPKRAYPDGVRVVPPAVARHGAYVSPGAVLMPSYVNIGAWVGEDTMVDTWATVGSCAQIGADVHLSGGVGIGGVLEPLQASPVIVEDGAFVGSRAIVVEGVRIGREAVLGANVVDHRVDADHRRPRGRGGDDPRRGARAGGRRARHAAQGVPGRDLPASGRAHHRHAQRAHRPQGLAQRDAARTRPVRRLAGVTHFDTAVALADLVDRLRGRRRPALDRAVGQREAGAVPRALDAPAAGSPLDWSEAGPTMRAARRERMEPSAGSRHEHVGLADPGAEHGALGQSGRAVDRGPVAGAVLEGGDVGADALGVGQMPAEVPARAERGRARQPERLAPPVRAASPGDERGGVERSRGAVGRGVEHAEAPHGRIGLLGVGPVRPATPQRGQRHREPGADQQFGRALGVPATEEVEQRRARPGPTTARR